MTLKKLFFVLPIFFVAFLITSCNKDTNDVSDIEIEDYTENAVFEMQRTAKCGKRGCFDFVFPITIIFQDSTTADVESYEDMKATIKAWKEANPDATERPHLSYPIDIMTDEGVIFTLDSKKDLKRAVAACVKQWVNNNPRLNNECYRVTFPVNIEVPNGDTITVNDKAELKQLLKVWAKVRPRPNKKPHLVFPLTIILKEDESTVTVENKEALKAIKEACREE